MKRLLLFLARSGFLEETYYTFSYSPVYDDAGRIAGMLCVVTEVTERVQGERGLRVLRDLAANVVGAQTVSDACRHLMSTLDEDPADFLRQLSMSSRRTGPKPGWPRAAARCRRSIGPSASHWGTSPRRGRSRRPSRLAN